MDADHDFSPREREPEQIDIQTLRVSGRVPYGYGAIEIVNYCYLVHNKKNGQGLLIDPAWELETIETAIRRAGARLTAILLTHSHFDHVNLVEALVSRYQAEVWMSAEEIAFYRFSAPNLRAIDMTRPFRPAGIAVTPYLTPGHSKGSTCFRIGEHLFSGDTLFIEGCGICVGDGADPREMFDSIALLKARCGREVRLYPGHAFGEAPGSSFEQASRTNVYLNLDDYEKFRSFRMRDGQSRIFDFK
jgi:hydroxyacylglutathione hydrolase